MAFIAFTNNKFSVLSLLYDVRLKGDIAHITQQEIADKLNYSRATVSKIMNFLTASNYIYADEQHLGRYYLTPQALRVVEGFRSI